MRNAYTFEFLGCCCFAVLSSFVCCELSEHVLDFLVETVGCDDSSDLNASSWKNTEKSTRCKYDCGRSM